MQKTWPLKKHKKSRKTLYLQNYQAKSTIVNPKISNADVFSIITDEAYGYANFLQLSYGSIIRSHTIEIKRNWLKLQKNYYNWP